MDETLLGGRYRRVRELGRGAMGQVWLAEDTLLHRRVAVKSVSSAIPAEPGDLNRVMREARLAAQLNHPNAVAVYDVVVDNNRPFVVMEYVPGESLADKIAAGPLSVAEVGRIGIAVAEALAEAHAIGLVHRDVKPANILINERGVPKLADFGIARLTADAERSTTGLTIGTPAYLAPEIARGATADARSDLWAFGITLYAALDGRSPFQQPGDNAFSVIARLANAPDAPPPRNGGALTPTIMRLLAVDPARRPSAETAAEMLRNDLTAGRETNVWSLPPYARAAQPTPPSPPAPVPTSQPTPQPPPARQPPPAMPLPLATAQFRPPPEPAPYQPEFDDPGSTAQLPAGERRRIAIAVVAAVFVVAAGIGTAIWLTSGTGSPSAGGSRSASSPRTSGPPSTPSRSGSSSSGPSSRSSPTTPAGVRYSAPGGITVTAPASWRPDSSAGIPTIRDYVAPGETRTAGTYFRIGIGNTTPKADIQQEAQSAVDFLLHQSPYTGVTIVDETFQAFQGTESVTIEYTGANKGVARHAIERLWIASGQTLIVQLNAAASEWVTFRGLFDGLVGSVRVTG